jgi:hypothetical protein
MNSENEIYALIITNDIRLLSKYIFAINYDEIKMLCRENDFIQKNIRIDRRFFRSYDDIILNYIDKMINKEILSANMKFPHIIIQPYNDPTIKETIRDDYTWEVNKEVLFYKGSGQAF